jgi:acyl-CoA synthetase (AMP-forming)/AMP-acid ligase II
MAESGARGPSLSLGYPGRPELTAARFVANPFRPGDRLFRTGDLARCGADGRVHLVGRLEQQVRIRGFLVNLAEVEEALKQHEDVCDAVAVVREVSAGDRRLFAYVTLRSRDGAVEEHEAALLERVRRTRPPYMVPAAVRVLSRCRSRRPGAPIATPCRRSTVTRPGEAEACLCYKSHLTSPARVPGAAAALGWNRAHSGSPEGGQDGSWLGTSRRLS